MTLLFSLNGFSQKLFDDYRTLNNPKNDSDIIGKIYKKGFHTGTGVSERYYNESDGLTKITSIDSTEAKAKFEVSVSKIVSGTIDLSNTKANTSNFDDIKIIEISDFSKIKFTKGKLEYVIAAIGVGKFDVNIDKEFDATLKAELEEELVEKFNIKPDITYNKKKAIVKIGGKLIIAQKLLKVKKDRYYIETINITDNNKKEWNDRLTRADNVLKFESINTINKESIPNSISNEHNGCFNLQFINSALPDPDTERSLSRELIVCPRCSDMSSDIKPNCQEYNPSTEYKNISLKRIATGMTDDYIVFYSVSIEDLDVNYEKSPRDGIEGDNFKIDDVKAKVIVRKNVYHYRIK
ncbi:MAG: hypothetical protein CMC75_10810 [Flavobacteriaceae bacterium]|nr:hypothetical protein [Flavobacteriaceae bacterium]